MKTPAPPAECLHLGPFLPPADSSCPRLCRHRCTALHKPVRPSLDCGDHCVAYAPDRPAGEEKRPT